MSRQLDSESPQSTRAEDDRRFRLGLRAIQIVATLGAFAYLAVSLDWKQLAEVIPKVSLWAVAATCAVYYLVLALGTVRWKLLLTALGAKRVLRFRYLFGMYLMGLFYNTFVPGGVGGDVVRGLATRTAFGSGGAAASLSVVFIERAMGLGGMFFVVATATMLFPLQGIPHLAGMGALGVLLSLGGFAGLAFARRLAPYLPGAMGRLALSLPVLTRLGPMPLAILTAVSTHALSALAGHLLIIMVAPEVTLAQSMTIVPLSLAMVYVPISVGGVGVVELALVQMLSLVGVSEEPAVVAALSMRACQWAVAAPGGLVALWSPTSSAQEDAADVAKA